MDSTQYQLSVVVPVYNNERGVPVLVERLAQTLPAMATHYEVILVNDGSRDGSWDRIKAAVHDHTWVRGINLMRNYGQHNALLCGIRAAKYDLTVTLDDDLQNPPEEIPKLLARLAEGFDVVYGAPQREQHGLLRDAASQVTKLVLQNAMGVAAAREVSAFRVFRTRIRTAFENFQAPYVSIDVLLTWGTSRFAAVRVRHDTRQIGVSTYTLQKLIAHMFNMMTGFSALPLQVASLLGLVFSLFGLLVFVYVIVTYIIRGGIVPGFTFLASVIAVFAGIQLFAVGMIGEYLARMHFRTMNKPAYVVEENTSSSQEQGPLRQ